MEQIQKHEYRPGGSEYYHHCTHCGLMSIYNRISKQISYHKDGRTYYEEPACITRTVNAPASEKAEK